MNGAETVSVIELPRKANWFVIAGALLLLAAAAVALWYFVIRREGQGESDGAAASSEDSDGTPASSEDSDGTPASSEDSDETPASSEDSDGTPASSEDSDETPVSSEDSDETPVSSEDSDETPVSSEDSEVCELSSWSSWSDCSELCGGGTQTRSRTILREEGQACPDTSALTETRVCNTQPCPSSTPATPADCVEPPWSECSKECGGGTKYRLKIWPGGGQPCPGLEETAPCNTQPCPKAVDCKVGPWSEWGPCDKECGGGRQQRTRQVLSYARYGGRPCREYEMQQSRECNTRPCNMTPECYANFMATDVCRAYLAESPGPFRTKGRSFCRSHPSLCRHPNALDAASCQRCKDSLPL
jgi:hypothetical protein